MTWDIGTDIGGTFTDIVARHTGTGETRTAKVQSRPDAPVDAMLAAIAAIGLQPHDVRRFIHGTTRVTNAIVQERLPPIALVATAGFEDVLEIGRYRRRDLYNLEPPPKAPPLVPHARCIPVQERTAEDGTVLLPLEDSELDRVAAAVAALGIDSVAVCLLHAYANPDHERRLGERLRQTVPYVSLSHEVNPEAREYERASSTAYNAAAMPVASGYLSELEQRLPLGPNRDRSGLLVFHSAGGMAPLAAARERPVIMAMSGPAAGVAASVSIARGLGLPRVLTFDMGGTTTDVCLVVNGQAEMTDTRMTGDRPLRQPMLAVQSIGAGGGSLVTLGAGGLAVGPQSAGVDPGPACYNRGGTRPTITDANAVLGYLDPAARLGAGLGAGLDEGIDIDIARAHDAIAPLARSLDLDVVDTALGIISVANATMARALRRVTVERGIDGRDCTLLAFGGGGPMHAAGLADLYGLPEIVVPAASSAFSALGCLTADLSFTEQQTIRLRLDTIAPGHSAEAFAARLHELEDRAKAPLLAAGAAPRSIEVTHVALMRYEAQSDATPVPFQAPLNPDTLRHDFNARHRAVYGYATEEPCVIEGIRIQARQPATNPPGQDRPLEGPAPSEAPARRSCTFPGARNVQAVLVSRARLATRVEGPAIITDQWSTVVLPPGWQARPTPEGHLRLTRISLAAAP